MRRVVVTGLGMVTPLGAGVAHCWHQALAGRSGVRAITHFDVSDLPVKIAGLVPRGTGAGQFDASALASAKDLKRLEDYVLFALAATSEALRDASWYPTEREQLERTGVMLGSGIGGLPTLADAAVVLHTEGARRVSPIFIPGALINGASGVVSIKHGFRGPNHSVVTACATGTHAIGDAARLIALGDADVMVAGGTEAALGRLTLAGFSQMRAMSTAFNEQPELASRPFDRRRDGFVIGEGAGVVILEALEHAVARGARCYAELLGYGLSGDAFHMSAPEPTGDGARRAMKAALARARLEPQHIDYINAHATSTPLGDPVELLAIRTLFGDDARRVSISSTKSVTGHLFGAAGAVEAIFSVLALRDGVAPPTANLDEPEGGDDLDLVPKTARPRPIRYVLSNSFGFGGTNAALVFGPAPS
jgi:3-oxoacyl-[acyl-carrier-protein] synthase II